jgi:hypothetical protein
VHTKTDVRTRAEGATAVTWSGHRNTTRALAPEQDEVSFSSSAQGRVEIDSTAAEFGFLDVHKLVRTYVPRWSPPARVLLKAQRAARFAAGTAVQGAYTMIRPVIGRALLVAIGAIGAGLVMQWRAAPPPEPPEHAPRSHVTSAPALGGVGAGTEGVYPNAIERRLQHLEARFAAAAAERQHLEEQLAAIATQLAARTNGSDETANAHAGASPPTAQEAPANAGAKTLDVDDSKRSAMERALTAAGIDAATVADIKRRQDESTMAEITLRNQATREQWLDSPRFTAEMAAIDAQRMPLRNEIGDDAYDRYLFALGQTNRVRVDDVLQESPAAQAGLQAGDLIVRYGDARLFNPSELVNETRSGTAGEAVQLEVIRDGQRFEVQVPRGPLGLRVAATQGKPDAS